MSEPLPRVAYGGQAVIEGVMMRGPHHFSVACRRSSGEIIVKEEPVPAFFTRYAWAKWPFLRGSFALADAMVLGMKSLLFSANLATAEMQASGQATGRGESAAPGTVDPGGNGAIPPEPSATPEEAAAAPVTSVAVAGSAFMGAALGLGLFVFLPSLVAGWLGGWLGFTGTGKNLLEGGLRIALVLGYIAAIGRMREVSRLFQYHGAEHKAINALEKEGAADVDAAMRQSTIHPRCGTNFVLTVLLVTILVFSLFGWSDDVWLRLALRLALLPVIGGVAYEVIRLAGRYRHVPLIQLLVLPGLLTQRLTTREPDRDMVEVAIAALKSVLRREAPTPAAP